MSFVHAPGDMHVGTAIIPRTAEWSEAKALLGDCSEDDVAEGGTTSRCRGGGVLLNYGSGNPDELWLRMTRP